MTMNIQLLSRCSKKWSTEQKTVCYLYPLLVSFPSLRNEKMFWSQFSSIFPFVTIFILADTLPFSSHRMDNYGQSQSACGQPWQAIKTRHLIISLSQSLRHWPIRKHHFSKQAAHIQYYLCYLIFRDFFNHFE